MMYVFFWLEFHPFPFFQGKYREYILAINYQNRHQYVKRISFIQHKFLIFTMCIVYVWQTWNSLFYMKYITFLFIRKRATNIRTLAQIFFHTIFDR